MTSNWKELTIADYIAVKAQIKTIEYERAEDEDIKNAAILMKKAVDKIAELEKPYIDKLSSLNDHIVSLGESLIEKWDIADKTYKCDAGIATLRTTKALKINSKETLINLLQNIGKLPQCIRSWNLPYLRSLKDVDLIDDLTAHYEESQNVVIKGVSE